MTNITPETVRDFVRDAVVIDEPLTMRALVTFLERVKAIGNENLTQAELTYLDTVWFAALDTWATEQGVGSGVVGWFIAGLAGAAI